MAEPSSRESDRNVFSEILSPSQLFAARSRSHKIPVRGQKDFVPDDSDEQRQRRQQSLSEHWGLVSEERVERLGNLVKASWIQREQLVELQSPAGKFWQTMGFSSEGKQFLLPEEALYLMECGNLQVFYQDLPLSIQDGYENFLSPNSVSLQQYQVFGHLKRLGYVVLRFDPSSEATSYSRQLNLPQSHDRAGRKRKRSVSPAPSAPPPPHSRTETRDSTETTAEEEKQEEKEDGDPLETKEVQMCSSSSRVSSSSSSRSWWSAEVLKDRGFNHSSSRTSISSSRWDFSSILFPDLGSRETLSDHLDPPDPSLLPGTVTVGSCHVAPWRRKINLTKVTTSPRDRRRDEDEQRRRRNRSRDREVQRCRNWTEYQELMAKRQRWRRRRDGRAEHLWNREVAPLHDPKEPTTTKELLEKISLIKPTDLLQGTSSEWTEDEWRISFSVYQPDTVAEFKKSRPGKPYTHMCVCSFHGPAPDLRIIKLLTARSGDVPLVFAVVDRGDVSFYTFKDFQLPTDVPS